MVVPVIQSADAISTIDKHDGRDGSTKKKKRGFRALKKFAKKAALRLAPRSMGQKYSKTKKGAQASNDEAPTTSGDESQVELKSTSFNGKQVLPAIDERELEEVSTAATAVEEREIEPSQLEREGESKETEREGEPDEGEREAGPTKVIEHEVEPNEIEREAKPKEIESEAEPTTEVAELEAESVKIAEPEAEPMQVVEVEAETAEAIETDEGFEVTNAFVLVEAVLDERQVILDEMKTQAANHAQAVEKIQVELNSLKKAEQSKAMAVEKLQEDFAQLRAVAESKAAAVDELQMQLESVKAKAETADDSQAAQEAFKTTESTLRQLQGDLESLKAKAQAAEDSQTEQLLAAEKLAAEQFAAEQLAAEKLATEVPRTVIVDDSPSDTVPKEAEEVTGYDDSQSEIAQLKAQVTKIAIVSSDDVQKEYVSTSFVTGEFADNPNLWKVPFGAAGGGDNSCDLLRLADLKDMEIHVGENFFAKLGDDVVEGIVDKDRPEQVAFCINERVWVTLSLRGISKRDQKSLKKATTMKMFDVLMGIAEQNNAAEFRVESMEFFTASVHGLMSHLKMDPETEQQRIEALEEHAFLGDIIAVMQANADGTEQDVFGQEFLDKANDIMDALLEAGWKRSHVGLETIIPSLMAAEQHNMSLEECMSQEEPIINECRTMEC